MDTKIYLPTSLNIKICAKLIGEGGIVAFPTETVYGLGANALNSSAVSAIYVAKGRPSDNPLIVHVASNKQMLDIVTDIPENAKLLIKAFMPGALTLVMNKKKIVPDIVTGNLATVAVRMPSHPVALALIRASGVPICAPSANTSSRPSPTMASHVYDDLNGKIPAIIDGGACAIGLESTVIDVTTKIPRLLRNGGISIEAIEKIVGKLEIVLDSKVALCPGMKYKHYAPKCEVLFSAFYDDMHISINENYDRLEKIDKNPVILCLSSRKPLYGDRDVMIVGATYEDYAHNLFAKLREAEKKYCAIIAEGVSNEGIGASIINRLVKSSGGQII